MPDGAAVTPEPEEEVRHMRREVEALRSMLREWLRLYREAGAADGDAAEGEDT